MSLSTSCQIAQKKKFRGENFVTTLKGEIFPAKLSSGEIPPPLSAVCLRLGPFVYALQSMCVLAARSSWSSWFNEFPSGISAQLSKSGHGIRWPIVV